MQARQSQLTQNAIQGLQAFNQQAFYEAHEWFERSWRESPAEVREFYRALLQLSGGYYRLTQDRPEAAMKFFKRAQHWLEPYPNPFRSINTDLIQKELGDLREALASQQPTQAIIKNHFHPIDFTQ
jgi:predicted metal-dependent hydrolase